MTTYEFKCKSCDITIEDRTRRFGDNEPPPCERCGHTMVQVIGTNPFLLKGDDWFKPAHYSHDWKMKK